MGSRETTLDRTKSAISNANQPNVIWYVWFLASSLLTPLMASLIKITIKTPKCRNIQSYTCMPEIRIASLRLLDQNLTFFASICYMHSFYYKTRCHCCRKQQIQPYPKSKPCGPIPYYTQQKFFLCQTFKTSVKNCTFWSLVLIYDKNQNTES